MEEEVCGVGFFFFFFRRGGYFVVFDFFREKKSFIIVKVCKYFHPQDRLDDFTAKTPD